MFQIPGPPPGTRIRVGRLGDGIRIRWRTAPLRYVLATRLYGALWGGLAVLLTLGAVGTCAVAADDVPAPASDHPFLASFLLIVSAGLAALAAASAHARWVSSHEELDITGEVLTHRAGRRSPGILIGRGLATHVLRGNAKRAELQGKGPFEVLALILDDHDVNIGRSLSHDEREWLAGVLRRWLEAGQ